MSKTDFNNTNSLGYLYSKKGYNEIVPTTDYANLFAKDDDIRKELIVAESEIKKYPGRSSITGLDNIPIIRLSDLYLMKAEILYNYRNLNQKFADTAILLLDQIRIRANPLAKATKLSNDDLLNSILLERRKELAYEGDRFFTLKRLNQSINRIDCKANNCSLNEQNLRFALPIPQNEINANSSIIQNQGY
jgi:starch-binding outer membrane protein, SusD/RagB family